MDVRQPKGVCAAAAPEDNRTAKGYWIYGCQVWGWKVELCVVSEASFQATAMYVSMSLWMLWHIPVSYKLFLSWLSRETRAVWLPLVAANVAQLACLKEFLFASSKSFSSAEINHIKFWDYAARFNICMKSCQGFEKLSRFCSMLDQRQLLWVDVYIRCEDLLSAHIK